MTTEAEQQIKVSVSPRYLEEESEPEEKRFCFAYTIMIQNTGKVAAKLLQRRWLITDDNGKTTEINGEGVVGEKPYLRPGEGYLYTSSATLETSFGTMVGSYLMRTDTGVEFDVPIPSFILSQPRVLH